jgi:hypothetical protein
MFLKNIIMVVKREGIHIYFLNKGKGTYEKDNIG